ncbi:hypothetical protein CLW00_104275 [Mongoliibacter ruber]|uniref:Uncharacterized protein n=1 Tax=Mongoliibacter ruber TaxID=1750599 RepID=A0A2T0WQ20_9BACT|nr:hypothetical protein CLW00_104275 [Mongoliibacter ruber]
MNPTSGLNTLKTVAVMDAPQNTIKFMRIGIRVK